MCLSQHEWKHFNSVLEKPVSRSAFMSVLGNIDYVVIKASYGSGLQQSRYGGGREGPRQNLDTFDALKHNDADEATPPTVT